MAGFGIRFHPEFHNCLRGDQMKGNPEYHPEQSPDLCPGINHNQAQAMRERADRRPRFALGKKYNRVGSGLPD